MRVTFRPPLPAIAILLAAFTLFPAKSSAQIHTNWVAYEDYRPNYTPTNGWVTAPRVNTYDIRVGPGDVLTNFLDGLTLPVSVGVVANGTPDDFGEAVRPNDGTPSAVLFKGVVDVANTGLIGVRYSANTYVNLIFSGLDPAKHYVFRGTSTRGGGYALRWTVCTIIGASDYVDAHIPGNGPGVITATDFPADLLPGQAAYNSGHNLEGAVVGWDFISPAPDGTFTIQSSNYVGHVPGGLTADATRYGYAIGAFLLAEVEVTAPHIVTQPAPSTMLEEGRPFSLTVAASGLPLFYQWFKEGVGGAMVDIPGARAATYSVAQASVSDSGNYVVRVYNPLGSETSMVAHVTVIQDVRPPSIATAFTYPSFDFASQVATLDQVIVEFNEAVDPALATDASRYTISGGNAPTSVTMTNPQTAVLHLGTALAEDSNYTVQVNGVKDVFGNNINNGGTNNPAPFRSWMRGPGNGLLFEVFNTGSGATVDLLTNSPVYPNNPIFRTNLWALDTRIVFPDDTFGDYGSRTRGVFIPPVSGNWVFFLRAFERASVYFNPNGLDPAGAQLLLAEVTGNNPRDWDKFISASHFLKAGNGYYIEALQKADSGTGVDVIKVAARLAGTGFPPVGIPNTDLDPNALNGSQIAYPLAPRDLGGTLSIVQQPTDLTLEDQHIATFSVVVNNPSRLPVFYQWYKDGTPILGATGPSYSFQVTSTDTGATFRADVAKVGAFLTTTTATLTVVPDTTPPRALSVFSSSTNLQSLVVQFSELINMGTAQDVFNYLMTDNSVEGATLQPDGTSVALVLANALQSGLQYELSVNHILDLSDLDISPDPTVLTFIAGNDRPRLEITLNGNTAVLSWPAPSPGFVLEQSSQILTPPSAMTWTPAPGQAVVNAGRNTQIVPLGPGTTVFRLRQ